MSFIFEEKLFPVKTEKLLEGKFCLKIKLATSIASKFNEARFNNFSFNNFYFNVSNEIKIQA